MIRSLLLTTGTSARDYVFYLHKTQLSSRALHFQGMPVPLEELEFKENTSFTKELWQAASDLGVIYEKFEETARTGVPIDIANHKRRFHSKLDAEIHNMNVYAKNDNLKGVRICNKKLENGRPVLCGNLHLPDTNAVRTLLFDPEVAHGIMKRWRQHRMNGFEILDKTGDKTRQKAQIWQYITKPASLTSDQLQYDILLPNNTDKDFQGVAKGYVSRVRGYGRVGNSEVKLQNTRKRS